VLRDRFHRALNSELRRQQRTIRQRWEQAREETPARSGPTWWPRERLSFTRSWPS
jgi:hypothetical protein